MVFGPATTDRPRLGLPSENFLLHLLEGGNTTLMCVWKSNRQDADALFFDDGLQRKLGGCEVRCLRNQSLWVALMAGHNTWYQQRPAAEETGKQVMLDVLDLRLGQGGIKKMGYPVIRTEGPH